MNRITALTLFAMSASALLARSPMAPKYIGWGGPGVTTYRNLITLIHPTDFTTGIYSRTLVVVDDHKPFLADFPFLAKVRVTIDGKANDYNLEPLSGAQVNSAHLGAFTVPTIGSTNVKLEFLRGMGRGSPVRYQVDAAYTRTLSTNQIFALANATPTDPDLQRPQPLASETMMRLPVTVLEVGKTVTLNGSLAFKTPFTAPNIRVRGYPVLQQLAGKVVKHGENNQLVPVDFVAVMGGGVDLGALTNLLGKNARVVVTGRYSRIYYVVNTGGPTEVVSVESIAIRGKQLPQDLPLTPARLQAVARQLVQNHLGDSSLFRVTSVTAQGDAFLYTVTVQGPRRPSRTYQVDLLDKSVVEMQIL